MDVKVTGSSGNLGGGVSEFMTFRMVYSNIKFKMWNLIESWFSILGSNYEGEEDNQTHQWKEWISVVVGAECCVKYSHMIEKCACHIQWFKPQPITQVWHLTMCVCVNVTYCDFSSKPDWYTATMQLSVWPSFLCYTNQSTDNYCLLKSQCSMLGVRQRLKSGVYGRHSHKMCAS